MAKRAADGAVSKITHDVAMGWIERAILMWLIRQGEGKGLSHGRMVRRTLLALEAGDDFGYLQDAAVNLLLLPGEQRLAMPPVPGIVKELVAAGFAEKPEDVASVAIMTRTERECPDRVLSFTTDQIEFLLRVAEEKPLRNVLMEQVVDALGDLEDAKLGRYELPEELRVQEAAEVSVPEVAAS